MRGDRRHKFDIVALSGCLFLLGAVLAFFCAPARASDLTRGKKALFSENFEMDIYEWTLMEEGEEEGEDPDLIRTAEAYEASNALLLSGKKGILGLLLIERVKGMVEFRVKFPTPHDYTRMFAVGLGDQELLLGVNRSDKFAYAVGGNWQISQIPVDEGWHTFTYDFSGGVTNAYIDGKLIITARQLREFDRVRLGINNGRGGRCLVDAFVIYATEAELSEENTIEVEIPLLGWEEDIKLAAELPAPTAGHRYSISDSVSHSGRHAAEISYGPLDVSEQFGFNFQRRVPLPGIPQKLSLWVYGDGSGVTLMLGFLTANSCVKYSLPPLDWTGWRKLEIDLTREADDVYPPKWDWVLRNACYEGTAFMQFVLDDVPAGLKVKVYVDDLALTTRLNKDLPYVFYAESTAEDGIVDGVGQTEFRLLVGNYGREDKNLAVDYTLQNFWGDTVRQGNLEMTVPAGKKVLDSFRIEQPLPHGWYQARLILSDGARTIAAVKESVAVLRPLPKSLFCPENPLGNYYDHSRGAAKVGLSEVYLGGPSDLRSAGAELIARWRPRARDLALMKEHNYTGIVFNMAPPWAFLPEGEMQAEAEKYADALSELAADLKGLPIYYKILSEPNNSGVSPERCYEVLKYAHKGLTKGDPDAKIIGLNTSKFDWGRQKVVWGLGGLKYVYAVGVHPYCGPSLGSAKPEKVHGTGNLMSMLRLDDMIRRYNNGEPKKIWASEVGYDTRRGKPHAVTWEEQANYMARMVIEFKTMDNFGKIHYHIPVDSAIGHCGIFTLKWQPKPLAVSFHSVAERMTGVKWLKTLETSENVRAYIFEQKDGRQMLAAWSVEGPDQFTLPVQCDAVELMDLMGVYHAVETPDGVLALDLTESAVFITPSNGELLADRWIQATRRYRQVRTGSKGTAFPVVVKNLRNEPLEGTLRCTPPAGVSIESDAFLVSLEPGQEKDYEFSIDVSSDCAVGLHSLAFRLEADPALPQPLAETSATVSVAQPDVRLSAVRVDQPPRLDGKLDDFVWETAAEITQFLDDNQGYLPELKQRLRVLYDLEGLYVGLWAEKKPGEELRAEYTARDDPNLWRDECVEVFLDPNLDRSNYFHLVANIVGNQSDSLYKDTKRLKQDWSGALKWNGQWEAQTFQTDEYWSAEVFIPWETVGVEPGAKCRMGLNVCRKYAPVGDPVIHSYTPGGVPVHAVGSYLAVEIDLTE